MFLLYQQELAQQDKKLEDWIQGQFPSAYPAYKLLEGTLDELGQEEAKTANAVSSALPLLVGALARNASDPSGAGALESALVKDHDGGILDDIAGALSGTGAGAGAGILRHAFGQKCSIGVEDN